MENLLSKRVVLVTGKGGVGRSTMAAALAVAAAKRGKKVLISDIEEHCGGHSPLGRLFGVERLPVTPKKLAEGISGGQLNASKGQELFLTSVLKVKAMARLAMRTKPLLSLLKFAPSFHEMGLFYHLLAHLKSEAGGKPLYDLILIDMPATGHTLALTALPEQLLSIIKSGPIASGMREGQAWLNNPKTGAAWIVTLPETLPITETVELMDGLRRTRMPIGGVILNMVPEDPFSAKERAAVERIMQGRRVYGQRSLDRIASTDRAVATLRRQVEAEILRVPLCKGKPEDLPRKIADVLLGDAP